MSTWEFGLRASSWDGKCLIYLPLCHPRQISYGCRTGKNPHELGVSRYLQGGVQFMMSACGKREMGLAEGIMGGKEEHTED